MMIDYEALAADYAASRAVHPGVLTQLLSALERDPAARVLEVGSGTGNYIGALAATSECTCWGVEPSPAMLATAMARWPQVQWRQGAAEVLPCADGAFDLIFTVDVVHHMTDVAGYYREACRVLAPGGRICTVTDSAAIIRGRRPLSTHWPATVPHELQRYPSLERLHTAMRAAGFAGIDEQGVEYSYALQDSEPYRRRAYSVLWLIPEAEWRAGLARLEADMALETVTVVARYVLLWGRKPET